MSNAFIFEVFLYTIYLRVVEFLVWRCTAMEVQTGSFILSPKTAELHHLLHDHN